MPIITYDTAATKKATNVSINGDLLRQAKEARINLSRVLEERLVQLLVEKKRQAWIDENRQALENYNRRITAHGVFSNGLRGF